MKDVILIEFQAFNDICNKNFNSFYFLLYIF